MLPGVRYVYKQRFGHANLGCPNALHFGHLPVPTNGNEGFQRPFAYHVSFPATDQITLATGTIDGHHLSHDGRRTHAY